MKSIEPTAASVTTDEQLSMAVIDLVSRVEDTDPVELEPLYDAIDPDLLDSLPDADGFTTLEFSYQGYPVTVTDADDGVEISLEVAQVEDESTADLVESGSP